MATKNFIKTGTLFKSCSHLFGQFFLVNCKTNDFVYFLNTWDILHHCILTACGGKIYYSFQPLGTKRVFHNTAVNIVLIIISNINFFA